MQCAPGAENLSAVRLARATPAEFCSGKMRTPRTRSVTIDRRQQQLGQGLENNENEHTPNITWTKPTPCCRRMHSRRRPSMRHANTKHPPVEAAMRRRAAPFLIRFSTESGSRSEQKACWADFCFTALRPMPSPTATFSNHPHAQEANLSVGWAPSAADHSRSLLPRREAHSQRPDRQGKSKNLQNGNRLTLISNQSSISCRRNSGTSRALPYVSTPNGSIPPG